MTAERFRISHVSFSYPGSREKALEDLSLSVEPGDFFLLCGASGSGKSTLLRQLKPPLTPRGVRTGEIFFAGRRLEELPAREAAGKIGFVLQSPEDQIVTDKVRRELAFAGENLGLEPGELRRRVAETASFFGIQDWMDRDTASLSGGEKQLLNLASVLVSGPDVLLLDEPSAQLDPVAAARFFDALERLNRELGITVLISEHRLEDVLPRTGKAALLDRGKLLYAGPSRELGIFLRETGNPMLEAMPAAVQVWAGLSGVSPCPVSVKEGKRWLEEFCGKKPPVWKPEEPENLPSGDPLLEGRNLWFRYEKTGRDVVRDFSVSVRPGEILALTGGNGAGKTTALKLLSGALLPVRGRVRAWGKTAYLPQDPRLLFVRETMEEDLREAGEENLAETVSLCRLESLLDRHPRDLSGGERQQAALGKLLLTGADVLLLDEPTKGLDAFRKRELSALLETLARRGKAVVFASHDMEFCAALAHRCILFFDGAAAYQGPPRQFFSGGSFYTTAANRLAGDLLPEAVTPGEIVSALGGEAPPQLPGPNLPPPAWGNGEEGQKRPEHPVPRSSGLSSSTKLPRRTQAAAAVVCLLVPFTLFLGMRVFGGNATLTSLLILLECMLPFFLVFEGKKPQARELVTLAALSALGAAGRAAFFMLPECKPVMAITITAGAAFGGSGGFLVGAVSMLVSNFFFSQGPWTPWQMFAMGLTGFCSGLLFQGRLRPTRTALGLYGILAAVILYGGIMNLSSALTWNGQLTWEVLFAYLASGFPMDCVHGAATCLFLWLGGPPLLRVLERVKT